MSIWSKWVGFATKENSLLQTPIIGVMAGLPLLSVFGGAALAQNLLRKRYVSFAIAVIIGLTLASYIGFQADWIPFGSLVATVIGALVLQRSQSWGLAIATVVVTAWLCATILAIFDAILLANLINGLNTAIASIEEPTVRHAIKQLNLENAFPHLFGSGAALLGLVTLYKARYLQSTFENASRVNSEINTLFWRFSNWVPIGLVAALVLATTGEYCTLYLITLLILPATVCLHTLAITRLRTFILVFYYITVFILYSFALTYAFAGWLLVGMFILLIGLGILLDVDGRKIEADLS